MICLPAELGSGPFWPFAVAAAAAAAAAADFWSLAFRFSSFATSFSSDRLAHKRAWLGFACPDASKPVIGNEVDDVAAPGIHAPHGRAGSVGMDVPVEMQDNFVSGVGCFFFVFVKASLSLGLFAPEPASEGKSAAGGRSMLD